MYRVTPQRCTGNPIRATHLVGILVFWVVAWPAWAAPVDPARVERLRLKALEHEKANAWMEAYRCYEEMLRQSRDHAEARLGQQRCLRRLHLLARHADPVYRQTLDKLTPPQALDAYEQILGILTVAHPDRGRVSLTHLFQQGLQELRLALDDKLFRRYHLPGVKPAAVEAFRARLAAWPLRKITSRNDAREQAQVVIRSAARDGIPLRPRLVSVLGMEFAAGACNGVDDYSAFLSPGAMGTPGAMGVLPAPRNEQVGVGMDVSSSGEVTKVYLKGPAAEAGIQEGDRLVRLGGQEIENLTPDAMDRKLRELHGKPGGVVEVEYIRQGDATMVRQPAKLVRRAVVASSVEFRLERLSESLVTGYLRINYFAESTPTEIKDAIAEMRSTGGEIKGLILDLRGNPGGLFKSAVAVAELFLTGGIIVIGQSPFKEYNKPFRVETSGPFHPLPLVVLIDAETASAAEVLAGALKEGRTSVRLVGQTSYGKGSIQCILPIEKILDRPAGIRLTVARLFSPSNQPYGGRGVTPTHPNCQTGSSLLQEARDALVELIDPAAGTLPPPMLGEMATMS